MWSELFLSKGEDYTNTFLKRAKGAALNISAHHKDPDAAWMLLSPRTEQIKCLNFVHKEWGDIQRFADRISGPLPLLQTLTIHNPDEDRLGPDMVDRPSPSLFSNAVNLRVFRLHSSSERSPLLSHFAFPKLVSFDFMTTPDELFIVSQLLDFLEASPMLQTIRMTIIADALYRATVHGRVVVLPNVKKFTLVMGDGSDGGSSMIGYDIATYLSCPSVRSTTFVHMGDHTCEIPPGEMFPKPDAWRAIVSQYTRRPIEEVELEIRPVFPITGKLTFRSSDANTIKLCFKLDPGDGTKPGSQLPSEGMHEAVFTQAVRTIRDHPQREEIKRLRICHSFRSFGPARVPHIANEVKQLFNSLGCLDQLSIHHCDLQPYIYPFLHCSEYHIEKLFPPTKRLEISHPLGLTEGETFAIVTLARVQHALGYCFEGVTIRACEDIVSVRVKEMLGLWVDGGEYFSESDDD